MLFRRHSEARAEHATNPSSVLVPTINNHNNTIPYRPRLHAGTFFLLKQGQVSLLVSVARLPHLSLSEQVIDQNSCRFACGPSPETTSV
jgi:hypothetical protein